MRKNRLSIFLLFLASAAILLSVGVSAAEGDSEITMPDEYGSFIDSLPEDIVDSLPESFSSDDPEMLSEGIREITDVENLLGLLFDGLLGGVKGVMPTLAVAIGIMLISAVIKEISAGFKTEGVSQLVFRLCLVGVVLTLVYSSISMLSEFFSQLCVMAAAYLPLSAVLYSIGGNVTTAAASSATFGVCLSVCQFIFTYTAIPVFVFSLSMAIVSSFYESRIVASISGAVKKYYTVLLSLVMTALSVSIGSQTYISAKADNAAMRGAKFLFGSFVPISGVTISSSLGAIASGVELIRGCVGIGGIVIIVLMLAPVICHLLVMKLFFFALETFSLATDGGNGVITQISSLYSYLLGIAFISSSVFILSFALLGSCAAAIG